MIQTVRDTLSPNKAKSGSTTRMTTSVSCYKSITQNNTGLSTK